MIVLQRYPNVPKLYLVFFVPISGLRGDSPINVFCTFVVIFLLITLNVTKCPDIKNIPCNRYVMCIMRSTNGIIRKIFAGN